MRAALVRGYVTVRHRDLKRALARIEQSQWLEPSLLERLQVEKLRAMLLHAGRSVPYYRDLFRRLGFEPQGLGALADLAALPPLDRETVAERFEDLQSRPLPPGARARATGGSTGSPLRLMSDQEDGLCRSAHLYRNLRWLGWDVGGRLAYVWGSDVDSREHRGWHGAARDAIAGVLWLDAFSLRRERLDDYLDRLASFDPDVLIGYPSSLHLLAERALARPRALTLRGIQTSAEMLAPRVRADLEAAFGCPVRDRYGCREVGVVAHECGAGRLHVNAETVVMECVDGGVLLTGLDNRAMPLIRYRNEDLAELSSQPCPCGRGLPVVRAIRGRLADVIRSPGGRLIHGEFFTHLFYDAPGVRRFQVHQTLPAHLRISVVAGPEFTPATQEHMGRLIQTHADPAFRVEWIHVSEIAPGPSGKFRFTISDVPNSSV